MGYQCSECKHASVDLSEDPCKNCAVVGGSGDVMWVSKHKRKATREEKISNPGVCEVASALDVQVAGDHYKGKGIQPVEYISANNLTFLEGCIVKRITRWRDKQSGDKFDDLNKIKHEVDLLIEMEKKYGG